VFDIYGVKIRDDDTWDGYCKDKNGKPYPVFKDKCAVIENNIKFKNQKYVHPMVIY
jgi:hypothetical protein